MAANGPLGNELTREDFEKKFEPYKVANIATAPPSNHRLSTPRKPKKAPSGPP